MSAIEGALCRFRPRVFKASSLQKTKSPESGQPLHQQLGPDCTFLSVKYPPGDGSLRKTLTHSLSHTLRAVSPPTPTHNTHSTQPQRSIAQTEGSLSQLKVTKWQVICQAVPELNPGTGFWGGQCVFEPEATNACLGSPPPPHQGLISTPVLPCSSLRSGRREMAPAPGAP